MNNLNTKQNLINITFEALKRLKSLINEAEEDVKAIKLGVKNGGCAGMAYTMDLSLIHI